MRKTRKATREASEHADTRARAYALALLAAPWTTFRDLEIETNALALALRVTQPADRQSAEWVFWSGVVSEITGRGAMPGPLQIKCAMPREAHFDSYARFRGNAPSTPAMSLDWSRFDKRAFWRACGYLPADENATDETAPRTPDELRRWTDLIMRFAVAALDAGVVDSLDAFYEKLNLAGAGDVEVETRS